MVHASVAVIGALYVVEDSRHSLGNTRGSRPALPDPSPSLDGLPMRTSSNHMDTRLALSLVPGDWNCVAGINRVTSCKPRSTKQLNDETWFWTSPCRAAGTGASEVSKGSRRDGDGIKPIAKARCVLLLRHEVGTHQQPFYHHPTLVVTGTSQNTSCNRSRRERFREKAKAREPGMRRGGFGSPCLGLGCQFGRVRRDGPGI